MTKALISYYKIDQNITRQIEDVLILILKETHNGYYVLINKYVKLDPYDDEHIFYFFNKDGYIQTIDFGSNDEYKEFIKRYSPLDEVYLKQLKKISQFYPMWDPNSISEGKLVTTLTDDLEDMCIEI